LVDSKLSDALLAAPSDMQSLQLVETHWSRRRRSYNRR